MSLRDVEDVVGRRIDPSPCVRLHIRAHGRAHGETAGCLFIYLYTIERRIGEENSLIQYERIFSPLNWVAVVFVVGPKEKKKRNPI